MLTSSCAKPISPGIASPATYREKAMLQTDVAVELCDIQEPVTDSHLTAEFITIGRLDGWRGFDLCIESVAKAVKVRSDFI